MTELISSRKNPRILQLVDLRENRRSRENSGLFVIEGMREIERALACKIDVPALFFCEELLRNPLAQKILETARGNAKIELVPAAKSAMEKASYRENPEGLIAVARGREHSLESLKLGKNPLILVLEAVEKPGNLGALLRTADSAGCDAVIACDLVGDIYNPNTVRASQGTLFSMPFALASKERVAEFLRSRGITIFATTPAAKKCYFDCDFRVPAAILLGTESTGLSDFWLRGNDGNDGNEICENESCGNAIPISIPQRGLADSLNVSMAAAICLFEAVRQRHGNA